MWESPAKMGGISLFQRDFQSLPLVRIEKKFGFSMKSRAYKVRFFLTNPVECVTIRHTEKTEITGARWGLGDVPLKVSVLKDKN